MKFNPGHRDPNPKCLWGTSSPSHALLLGQGPGENLAAPQRSSMACHSSGLASTAAQVVGVEASPAQASSSLQSQRVPGSRGQLHSALGWTRHLCWASASSPGIFLRKRCWDTGRDTPAVARTREQAILNYEPSWAQWHTPVFPATQRLRQEGR